MITVRSELSRDRDAIRRVNELAFAGPLEADIVDALRDSDAWLPELSLVAEDEHPDYYPRFGFRPARRCGIETPYEAPDEAWMALPLPAHDESVRGTVLYPSAWERV